MSSLIKQNFLPVMDARCCMLIGVSVVRDSVPCSIFNFSKAKNSFLSISIICLKHRIKKKSRVRSLKFSNKLPSKI